MKWLRLYVEVLDDPKVQTLSDFDFRFLINLWCIASLNQGVLPSESDISFRLRQRRPTVGSALDRLRTSGLLDLEEGKLRPHNWDERQFKSDDIALRVKAYRDRSRVTGNVTCNVTNTVSGTLRVTPPDTDTETEAETDLSFESICDSKEEGFLTSLENGNGSKPKRRKSATLSLTLQQEEWFAEYLTEHPKGDCQTLASKKLFALKVTDKKVFDWVIGELRRQKVGDTTFMKGPWKWLQDQLERYASGVTGIPKPAKPIDTTPSYDELFGRGAK